MENNTGCNNPENFYLLSTNQQKILLDYIQNCFTPIETFNSRHTSYGLKHCIQNEYVCCRDGFRSNIYEHYYKEDWSDYFTNGEFKGAMLEMGYKVKDRSELNWVFNVSEKSPAIVRRRMLYMNIRHGSAKRTIEMWDNLMKFNAYACLSSFAIKLLRKYNLSTMCDLIEFLEKNYNDSAEENKLNEYQGIIDELVWFAVGYLRKSSFYNYIVSYRGKKYMYPCWIYENFDFSWLTKSHTDIKLSDFNYREKFQNCYKYSTSADFMPIVQRCRIYDKFFSC